jgi:hypothetical protein
MAVTEWVSAIAVTERWPLAVKKRVLMILTPETQTPGEMSGPQSEIISSYYLLQDSGFEVVLATPAEEVPWTWRESSERSIPSPSHRRLHEDQVAQDAFADMLTLQQICVDDFAAAICIGASIVSPTAGGPHHASKLANAMLAAGKPVVAIASADILHPVPASEGLLIVSSSKDAHLQATRALIGLIASRDQRHGA